MIASRGIMALHVSAIQRFLLWIHRHPRAGWLGLLAYAALVTFPHENVQYVVNELALKISHKRVYQLSAAIVLMLGIALSWILWRRRTRRIVAVYWLLTLALIFGTWRLMTANNVELVHYPQYVPEGM